MTDSVVAEGHVKLRDGKKWKNRWLVLRKPSPVADCLLMLVFKDKSEKSRGNKERSSVVLEDICGLEPGLSFEGVNHILAIICLGQTVLLAFENKDTMCAWDIRTRYSLGEVHRFHVTVLPGTKLESGPATLHFCNNIFVLVRDVPPIIIGHWKLSDMRRYGAIPNGFVFEGGSRCGPWAGVFFLSCTDGERISFLFDCIVRGISPTKGPFGLRPVLPDPSISPASIEERISYEAQELEKRLSILSQSSRHSSGGDDRSLSSSTESSDTSQSDSASVGSRLTLWPEQPVAGGPPDPMLLMPPPPASRPPGLVEEVPLMETAGRGGLRGAGTGVAPHLPPPPPLAPATKPPRPRKLQEVGRQSSSDSGFATGSFSSSSCAGSLADDFGSQLSLPSLRAPRSPGLEYGRPSAPLHHHYDTPRSVLSGPGPAEQAAAPVGTGDSGGEIPADFLAAWLRLRPTGQAGEPGGGPGISVLQCESCELGTGPPFTTACQSCGGLKGTTALQLGASSIFAFPGTGVEIKEKAGRVSLLRLLGSQRGQRREQPKIVSQTDRVSWQSILGERYDTLWDFRTRHPSDKGGCHPGVTRTRQPVLSKDPDARGHTLRRSYSAEEGLKTAPGGFPRHGVTVGREPDVPGGGDKGNGTALPQRHSGSPVYETMVTACHSKPGLGDASGWSRGYRPLGRLWGALESVRDAYEAIAVPGPLLAAMSKAQTFPGTRGLAGHRANSLGSAAEPYQFPQAPALKSRGPESFGNNLGVRGHETEGVRRWASRQGQHLSKLRTAKQELAECEATSWKAAPTERSDIIEDKKTMKKDEKQKMGQMYELMESLPMEKQLEAEKGSGYEYMASCGQQKLFLETEGPPGALKSHRGQGGHLEAAGLRQKWEKGLSEDEALGSFDTKRLTGGAFAYSPDLSGPDRSHGEGATYVNIPVSPVSKKQLHYMELELQEPGAAIRGASSSKYAQIDITATETAHKVGSQHAQHREERLQELEQKRKGPPLQ
ncbi:uncharacterized protein dok7b isoform X2 [Hypanus sabinus]|uniref:uncharacterized protein dok7b isoform X2 n=1 Tax=Hypanus sabinus TaxID=79690 RepID=UPI0028C5029D|nr:uncharacterized protein dok7b isoform X2 [Hypanus sabinus]